MQEFTKIELLTRSSIFMKKELGNGQRNKKTFLSLEQRQLVYQKKGLGDGGRKPINQDL